MTETRNSQVTFRSRELSNEEILLHQPSSWRNLSVAEEQKTGFTFRLLGRNNHTRFGWLSALC